MESSLYLFQVSHPVCLIACVKQTDVMKVYRIHGLKIIGVILLSALFFTIPFNCPGIKEKQAVDISSLWVKKNKRLGDKAHVASVESQGKEWLVRVVSDECVIYIVVDKCGHIWDAAGLSEDCDYEVKYDVKKGEGFISIIKDKLDYLRAGSYP